MMEQMAPIPTVPLPLMDVQVVHEVGVVRDRMDMIVEYLK
jgi:hypothetical protein